MRVSGLSSKVQAPVITTLPTISVVYFWPGEAAETWRMGKLLLSSLESKLAGSEQRAASAAGARAKIAAERAAAVNFMIVFLAIVPI